MAIKIENLKVKGEDEFMALLKAFINRSIDETLDKYNSGKLKKGEMKQDINNSINCIQLVEDHYINVKRRFLQDLQDNNIFGSDDMYEM